MIAAWPKEYRAWRNMLTRCYNPNASSFKYYGGRGITVCERWQRSFDAFLADVGPAPSNEHSIDRFPNNNGNYELGNVRWATHEEQQKNKRRPEKQVVRGVPADGHLRRRVRALVGELGDKQAARAIGIGRATLSRLLAELPLAPGTFALIREYFSKQQGSAA